jgi:hypothetical protein
MGSAEPGKDPAGASAIRCCQREIKMIAPPHGVNSHPVTKDTARRGETIEAENRFQHAEHYFRVMRERE